MRQYKVKSIAHGYVEEEGLEITLKKLETCENEVQHACREMRPRSGGGRTARGVVKVSPQKRVCRSGIEDQAGRRRRSLASEKQRETGEALGVSRDYPPASTTDENSCERAKGEQSNKRKFARG